ncbi:MAG: succinate dehydrogenase cytochrome b subunit [Longimicrobiales bacterium]
MRRVVALYRSSVGKKVLMAVTGFIWFGYLVGHVAGNLKAFQGAEAFNEYAHHLRVLGEPILPENGFLWLARAVLFGALLAHVVLAWQTSRQSHRARTQGYRKTQDLSFSGASRWMRWGGVLILVFLIYHILHLTTGTLHPDYTPAAGGEHYAYENLVRGLSSPVVAGFYVLAMVAIAAHLFHGVWSMMQTLGAAHPKYKHLRRPAAVVAALAIFFGFISIPVAVLAGIVSL